MNSIVPHTVLRFQFWKYFWKSKGPVANSTDSTKQFEIKLELISKKETLKNCSWKAFNSRSFDDSSSISYCFFNSKALHPISHNVQILRLIKSEKEIALLKKSAKIASNAFTRVWKDKVNVALFYYSYFCLAFILLNLNWFGLSYWLFDQFRMSLFPIDNLILTCWDEVDSFRRKTMLFIPKYSLVTKHST